MNKSRVLNEVDLLLSEEKTKTCFDYKLIKKDLN